MLVEEELRREGGECDHKILSTFGCFTLICLNLSRSYDAVKILASVGVASEGLWFIFI